MPGAHLIKFPSAALAAIRRRDTHVANVDFLNNELERLKKEKGSDFERAALEKVIAWLGDGRSLRLLELTAQETQAFSSFGIRELAPYTLLPLHFSFCLTTLKKETSGITASGNVLFAFRMATSDPTSTCTGSRPSTLRYTG